MERWLQARSLARGLPPPVRDSGGFRVDTGLPNELRRYVFAAPGSGIRELAHAITEPRIFIKLCAGAGADALRALLPSGWVLHAAASMMSLDGEMPSAGVPPEYALTIAAEAGGVRVARVLAPDGSLAARGRAVSHCGIIIYDQIVVDPGHQRLGLGRAVMAGLEKAARIGNERQVLVATPAGRGLYQSLGWTVIALYETAEYRGTAFIAAPALSR